MDRGAAIGVVLLPHHRRTWNMLVPLAAMLMFHATIGSGFVYKLMNATRFSAAPIALLLASAVGWAQPGSQRASHEPAHTAST